MTTSAARVAAMAEQPSDEALSAAVRGGVHDAFAELFRRNADQVRAGVTPAWIRLPAGAELSLVSPGRAGTKLVVPAARATLAYRLASARRARGPTRRRA